MTYRWKRLVNDRLRKSPAFDCCSGCTANRSNHPAPATCPTTSAATIATVSTTDRSMPGIGGKMGERSWLYKKMPAAEDKPIAIVNTIALASELLIAAFGQRLIHLLQDSQERVHTGRGLRPPRRRIAPTGQIETQIPHAVQSESATKSFPRKRRSAMQKRNPAIAVSAYTTR